MIMLVILTVLELNTFQKIPKMLLIIKTSNDSMCRYFCIGFIDFMLKGKSLTVFTNLFSPNNF